MELIDYRRFSIVKLEKGAKGPRDDGPRINEAIRVAEVRLIDDLGENRGVVTIKEALQIALNAGLDLIEISPNAEPPVCKVLDYGKFKYEEQKRKAEAKKNQKVVNIKEIKIRPNIEEHDYQVKLKAILKFISDEDKVKVTMRFKGREMAYMQIARDLFSRIIEDTADKAKPESTPKVDGKQMMVILSPEK